MEGNTCYTVKSGQPSEGCWCFCTHSSSSFSVYSKNYLCPVSMSLIQIQCSPVIFQSIKNNKMEPDSDSDNEQNEPNEKKRLKSGGEGICCVCGDAKKVFKMYGAKSICFPCRNFFRTSVKGKMKTALKCIMKNPVSLCLINKSTRTECK